MKRRTLLQAAGAAAISAAAPAVAQSFPARPVTLLVPFPAGGPTDITMRTLAEVTAPHLGQSIVVENRPGAGGTLGVVALALARPDGYLLRAAAASDVPHPAHAEGGLESADRRQLRDRRLRLYVWCRRAAVAVQELPRPDRLGAEGIRASSTTFDGHRHQSAPDDGRNRADAKREVQPRAVQGQCRPDAGDPQRPDDGGRRFDRIRAARRVRQAATAVHLGRAAHATLQGCADAVRTGLRHRLRLAVRARCGKDTDPAIVGRCTMLFSRGLRDAKHLAVLDRYDQDLWYQASAEYESYARATYVKEKRLIERLGLASEGLNRRRRRRRRRPVTERGPPVCRARGRRATSPAQPPPRRTETLGRSAASSARAAAS